MRMRFSYIYFMRTKVETPIPNIVEHTGKYTLKLYALTINGLYNRAHIDVIAIISNATSFIKASVIFYKLK